MKVTVKESTKVKPITKTPNLLLWNSNIDLVMPPIHTPCVLFYRHDGTGTTFFDIKVIKDALSRVLVPFYPVAGRLKVYDDGRININCQGQGVLFVEANSDGVIDDLGDFAPTSELNKLIPNVDTSMTIESCPLFHTQVTYFKCGGASLGVRMHHFVADGSSAFHFCKSWSEMARGLDLTTPPFLDRTLLRARDPPRPVYEHLEYHNAPLTSSSPVTPSHEIEVSSFKITRDQLKILKENSKKEGNTINFSSFEIFSAHIWKCVCEARGLPVDQKTTLFISIDGRTRFQPALPPGYFGNVVFTPASRAVAGKIQSNSTWYGASIIHDALVKMNDDYLMSTIDYLELQPDINDVIASMVRSYSKSNLKITSWVNFPGYQADFGWGPPIFVGPGDTSMDGVAIMSRGPVNDGSLSIVIWLQPQHMELFKKLFYLLPSKL